MIDSIMMLAQLCDLAEVFRVGFAIIMLLGWRSLFNKKDN